ncbi:Gfo/Idh/MocA family protein [Jannaschia pohangensis]|uniref:Gfo/Idh/MocA family protein n=1 Tax=Jannaschia pohangensis TaxID=390807 RepID=UPI00248209F9|nr:Gfo/Idh/MocA family oxidoreductase [Jannaschia pohangensis]
MRPSTRLLAERLPELGRIASVELRVPWWRDQGYYDAPGRGTFARDGGGVLITQGIHAIDLMLHLCGPVTAVQAMVATTALHRMEAEDFASAGFTFASGAVGSLMASVTHRPGGVETLVLNGTAGSARLAGDVLRLDHADGRQEVAGAEVATGGGADPMAFDHAWHQAVIAEFADSLRAGRPPAITGQSALPALALIDAIQASARTGTRQEVAHV